MLCPTRRFLPAVLLPTIFLFLASQGEAAGPDAGADGKPGLLDVLLPADAELRVEGHKTRSTGEVRHFESPPLPAGKTCTYSLQASWRGHTVNQKVRLRPGQLETVDFRKELQALTIKAPERVASSKPKKEPSPPTPRPPVTEPKKKPEKKPESKSDTAVRNGPEKKPETKPETTPPTPAPRPSPMSVAVSPAELTLRPGQAAYVEVKVAGERRQALPAEPTIARGAAPEGLTWQKWTATDFTTNPKVYTAGFALKAGEDIKPGKRSVKVLAAAGAMKSECSLAVTIKRPELDKPTEEPSDSKAAPTLALQIETPSGIELRQGRTAYAELTVKTADGSPLPEAPSVTLEYSPEARICASPWTSSFEAGQSTCTVGLAITAKADAPIGKREVRLHAAAGGSTAQRTLKVTVIPAPAAPRTIP